MQKVKICVFIIALVTGVTMVPMVNAQENTNSTETNVDTGVAETDVNATEDSYEFIGCISNRCVLEVIDYNINSNGLAEVTVYSHTSQKVTLTEMHMGDGFKSLNQKKGLNIPEGKVTLRIYVDNSYDTMGFTVANGHGIAGFKDSSGGFSFDGSYPPNSLMFMGIFGFIGGVGMVGVAAWKRKIQINGKTEKQI
jgi:hypothetical protein